MAAMSPWRWLEVPIHPPTETEQRGPTDKAFEKDCILSWGGSIVTGQFAIQPAAHAGLDVIAVCSSRTEEIVRKLKPKHVVIYTGKTDDELVWDIRGLRERRISKAIDFVGPQTSKLVLGVIAEDGEEAVVNFAPLAFMSSKQTVPENARVHNVEMKQFVLDEKSEVYSRRLNERKGARYEPQGEGNTFLVKHPVK
ncbi:hypothetical protein GE09DRAFT_1241297 [Coniochaeta sp. 2T2.1]|nr:hypothetical protein GE09DRAFT_1241297 [Coniochaeta sp. 2T2.1]